MLYAARKIHDAYHCAVLVKGGHLLHTASDLLYSRENVLWFEGKRINNPNTHGTGCTLSSAIAATLRSASLTASVQNAKDYISGALFAMLDLGRGLPFVRSCLSPLPYGKPFPKTEKSPRTNHSHSTRM